MTEHWKCTDFEERLDDYREGTLPAPEAAAARRHATECAACAELLARVNAALEQLAALPELDPPARLYQTIFAQTVQPKPARPALLGSRASWSGVWQAISSPRFAMGLAMSVFAFSLVLNAAQVNLRDVSLKVSLQDASWSRLTASVERGTSRGWARAVSYYQDLRVVYEIQAALHQMRQAPAPPAAPPAGHSQSRPPLPNAPGLSPSDAPSTIAAVII